LIKIIINETALETAIARTNLSHKQLALHMGISRCYLSRILNGKEEPSSGMRQRLLDYFKDCTFDDLFIIEENKNGQRRSD
jgi:transcriptional regulator with XRE-family HTH domain